MTATPATIATPAQRKAAEKQAADKSAKALAALRTAYLEALAKNNGAESSERAALDMLTAAKLDKSNARVWLARSAYRLATHPAVQSAQTRAAGISLMGAARVIADGNAKQAAAIKTVVGYHVKAGEALAKKDSAWVLRTTAPTEEERAVVERVHDKLVREAAKLARDKKAAADAAKAAKLAKLEEAKLEEAAPAAAAEAANADAEPVAHTTVTADDKVAATAPEVPADATGVTLTEVLAKLDAAIALATGLKSQGELDRNAADRIEDKVAAIAALYADLED